MTKVEPDLKKYLIFRKLVQAGTGALVERFANKAGIPLDWSEEYIQQAKDSLPPGMPLGTTTLHVLHALDAIPDRVFKIMCAMLNNYAEGYNFWNSSRLFLDMGSPEDIDLHAYNETLKRMNRFIDKKSFLSTKTANYDKLYEVRELTEQLVLDAILPKVEPWPRFISPPLTAREIQEGCREAAQQLMRSGHTAEMARAVLIPEAEEAIRGVYIEKNDDTARAQLAKGKLGERMLAAILRPKTAGF